MSLTFDELLVGEEPADFPEMQELSTHKSNSKSSSPLSDDISITHYRSDTHRGHDTPSAAPASHPVAPHCHTDNKPCTEDVCLPNTSILPPDGPGMEIDPSLLNSLWDAPPPVPAQDPPFPFVPGGEQDGQDSKSNIYTPMLGLPVPAQEITSPSDWLNTEPTPFIPSRDAQPPPRPKSKSKSKSRSPSPSSPRSLAKRWQIDTSAPSLSGPPSEVSSPCSRSASRGVGIESESGQYSPTGTSEWDISRSNSSLDLPLHGHIPHGPRSPGGEYPGDAPDAPGVPPPKRKKSHARKQPPGHIKRARNAFILFRKHVTDSGLIPPSVEVKHQNISVVAAKMWREAPPEVRHKFQEEARLEKEEHQRLYPGYRYQPVFRRTDIIRRRVRKDQAEDEKVEAVAEALINGKAGDALEKEIKEQMVQRASDVSESEAESSRPTSRRRRRDQGQMSKGAMRAQRAQARAKQMRQNLLGSNLLSMSMYNAAQQQAQQAQRAMAAQSTAASAPYGMEQGYMPIGYDVDGRPLVDPAYGVGYPGEMYGDEVYRLPPIVGYSGAHPGGPEGWDHGVDPHSYYAHIPHEAGAEEYYPSGPSHVPAHSMPGYGGPTMEEPSGFEYALPPLDFGGHGSHVAASRPEVGGAGGYDDDHGEDPRMRWTSEVGQTPSGHVMFNERLFDGALGSAALSVRRDEDGLGSFEEAVAQASEMHW